MGGFPDLVEWWRSLGRPLRHLPRWAAALVLVFTALACVWSVPAVERYTAGQNSLIAAKSASGSVRDMELYRAINARMEAGEGYYEAALDEQRKSEFPTRPFVTVRSPVVAWGNLVFGQIGWRIIALATLLAAIFAWTDKLTPRTVRAERLAAALLIGVCGAVAGMEDVGLVHEIIAGLFLALALGLYRPERWWPSLLFAALALAVRELSVPFVLLWAVFAAVQRRWRELAAIIALLGLFAAGMALHAHAVISHQLPGDETSQGWHALQGPALFLYGLRSVTLVQTMPAWIGPPLLVLALLGWIGLGGRVGLFATLWFAGMGLAVSLFARPMNFYWLALLIPTYGAGLAFVPRAMADLVSRFPRNPRYDGAAGSASPPPRR